eukprot:TRINITY_DN9587_c0_g1_i11.p1 TRINITY_DN9587_c0_g1~~TRINITY_DN9587_c0_g1_i11.p1  ORF type:complete len:326 (-),score=48.82 TRINITY_DN9587_c0_g1_i11:135-1112(-)
MSCHADKPLIKRNFSSARTRSAKKDKHNDKAPVRSKATPRNTKTTINETQTKTSSRPRKERLKNATNAVGVPKASQRVSELLAERRKKAPNQQSAPQYNRQINDCRAAIDNCIDFLSKMNKGAHPYRRREKSYPVAPSVSCYKPLQEKCLRENRGIRKLGSEFMEPPSSENLVAHNCNCVFIVDSLITKAMPKVVPTSVKPLSARNSQANTSTVSKSPNRNGRKQLTIAIKGEEWLKQRDRRLARKVEEQEESKLEGCTFNPNVNKRSKALSKQHSNYKDFHSDALDPYEVSIAMGSNSYARLSQLNAKSRERQKGIDGSLSNKH